MNTRTRPPTQNPNPNQNPNAVGDGDTPGNANELRERARDLLTAADRAIDSVLSPDSAQFLRNSVQSGGQ